MVKNIISVTELTKATIKKKKRKKTRNGQYRRSNCNEEGNTCTMPSLEDECRHVSCNPYCKNKSDGLHKEV